MSWSFADPFASAQRPATISSAGATAPVGAMHRRPRLDCTGTTETRDLARGTGTGMPKDFSDEVQEPIHENFKRVKISFAVEFSGYSMHDIDGDLIGDCDRIGCRDDLNARSPYSCQPSPSRSRSRTPTRSHTPTATPRHTRSPTRSHTPSPTRSHSPSTTQSQTPTATPSKAFQPSVTHSQTERFTPSMDFSTSKHFSKSAIHVRSAGLMKTNPGQGQVH
jgi:hypothetical protein